MDEPDRQAMRDAGRGHLLGESEPMDAQERAERLEHEAEAQIVWEIRESETREFVGVVQASCATDALAEYAMASGYADPREADPREGYFGLMPDASVSMVIENRTVYAVEQAPPS